MYTRQNIEALFYQIGNAPGQKFEATPYFNYVETKNSIWPNQLFGLKTINTALDTVLDIIKKMSSKGDLPNMLAILEEPQSSETIKALIKAQFSHKVWATMSHNLSELHETAADLEIIELRQEHELTDWVRIVKTELMEGKALDKTIFDYLLNRNGVYFYTGYSNNKPVTTAMLFEYQGVGGLYLVATDADHRKKGYGTAITNHCLLKARDLGLARVDIHATSIAENVYLNLGFKKDQNLYVFRIEDVKR